METSPDPNVPHPDVHEPSFGRTAKTLLAALSALLVLCLVFLWSTRDAMQHLPNSSRAQRDRAMSRTQTLVDQSPWQTAQALAAMAVTAEEDRYAREAERLADHEVDQAFAAALREATLRVQNRTLTGEALALSNRVHQLEQMVAQDQATMKQLTAKSSGNTNGSEDSAPDSDLEIAKAQLGLDSDELADANEDLDRATGDERSQIQSELAAHEAAMKKYDSQGGPDGQIAVLSVGKYGTLAGKLGAWNRQLSRIRLLQQAQQHALEDAKNFTEKHNQLAAQADAMAKAHGASDSDRVKHLAAIKDLSVQREILSIYDDRIQTEQRLADVYEKWANQVQLQHRIVLHLILSSLVWIVATLVCMVLGHGLVRRIIEYPVLERRQRQTLRAILELAVQLAGALCILFILFGAPQQTSTMIGITTAALTIALQDFVIAFCGWFALMGRRGMRVGDTVEINGVGGEVIEIGLLSTTLLETGSLADKGYPTGRRITVMNSFAIRGQYFNFSTAGQWMMDRFTVSIPSSEDTHATIEKIQQAVEEETAENARIAEREWKRAIRSDRLQTLRAAPSVNLRPSGNDFEVEVRYVTRATERVETRNRLYRRVIDLLHRPSDSKEINGVVADAVREG